MPPLCLGVPAISCNNQAQLLTVWGLAASHPASQARELAAVTPGSLGHRHWGRPELLLLVSVPRLPPLSSFLPVINLTKMTADRCQPLQRSNEIYGSGAVHQGADQSTPNAGTYTGDNPPRINLPAIVSVSVQVWATQKWILTKFNPSARFDDELLGISCKCVSVCMCICI